MNSEKQIKSNIEKSIKEVYEYICNSFSELDFTNVLSYFDDSENMVKISNGKILRGKKELEGYWKELINTKIELNINIENVKVNIIDEKHVWTTADEYISLNGSSQKAIVSNIFVLTSRGWKILLDHTTYK